MPNASELTPRQIVAELDRYIIGQDKAKRAVAVALRNRIRRQRLDDDLRDEVIPKNILMIGPTGVGKTEIARRLANLAGAPMVKVEATKFTEVGYVGRDVDSMVRDLIEVGVRMVETEQLEQVQATAAERATERILDLLVEAPEPPGRKGRSTLDFIFAPTAPAEGETAESDSYRLQKEQTERLRAHFRKKLAAGELEDRNVELEVEEPKMNVARVFGPAGMEEMGFDLAGLLGGMQKERRQRKMTVAEARRFLTQEEAQKLVDRERVIREAIHRVEQAGIIFVDEIDKVAGREGGHGPDVSREGVQRDILPIVEGSTVMTKYGHVKTHHVLFIAAGAFHISKPSDLIPELQGRFPTRVELEALTEDDFKRILCEPRSSLVKQYQALLATEGVTLEFTDDGVAEIARLARVVNDQTVNIGARRLHTVMERLLEELSFEAPEVAIKHVVINRDFVNGRLADLVKDEDLSRYIL